MPGYCPPSSGSPCRPAFTFVLIFILVFSFLEKLIEVDCGENHRPPIQVAESRWILLANIFFSAWSSDWRGVGEIAGGRTTTKVRRFGTRLPQKTVGRFYPTSERRSRSLFLPPCNTCQARRSLNDSRNMRDASLVDESEATIVAHASGR